MKCKIFGRLCWLLHDLHPVRFCSYFISQHLISEQTIIHVHVKPRTVMKVVEMCVSNWVFTGVYQSEIYVWGLTLDFTIQNM